MITGRLGDVDHGGSWIFGFCVPWHGQRSSPNVQEGEEVEEQQARAVRREEEEEGGGAPVYFLSNFHFDTTKVAPP